MVRFLFLLFLWVLIPGVVQSQHRMDTLPVPVILQMEKATDIYALPHPRYTLDHYVIVREREGADRAVCRNKGDILQEETKLFLRDFRPGDQFIIRKVSAVNKDAPERGWVKLKAMEWLVL